MNWLNISYINGLNIISGPSNTGKTSIAKSIDYIYGSKKENTPFSVNDTGYNKVEMIINPHQGIFSLERLFDDNKIIVNEITDGRKKFYKEYNARNGNNIISHFWLSMIGIDNPLQIIKNESFVRQNFGWRTFSPSTLISQNKIDSETSVLLPDMRQQTAFLVCFIYFMRMISMIQKKKKQKNKERFEENQ